MKKKLLVAVLATTIAFSLVGCGEGTAKLNTDSGNASYEVFAEDDRFLKIESVNGWIYVDKETKVQYLFVKRMDGAGLTVLLNSDGTPLLYEED